MANMYSVAFFAAVVAIANAQVGGTGCSTNATFCGGHLNQNSGSTQYTVGSLYACQAGKPELVQVCAGECLTTPDVYNDVCVTGTEPAGTPMPGQAAPGGPSACPSGSTSNFCGGHLNKASSSEQYQSGSIYSCQNGSPTLIRACAKECLDTPDQYDDVCVVSVEMANETVPAAPATSGAPSEKPCPTPATFCGGHLNSAINSNQYQYASIYSCKDNKPTLVQACTLKCLVTPDVLDDVCVNAAEKAAVA